MVDRVCTLPAGGQEGVRGEDGPVKEVGVVGVRVAGGGGRGFTLWYG